MKIDKLFFLVMENITPEKIFQQQKHNEKIKRKRNNMNRTRKKAKKQLSMKKGGYAENKYGNVSKEEKQKLKD